MCSCTTFVYQWKCSYDDLAGHDFDFRMISPSFVTNHNGALYRWNMIICPAGSVCDGNEQRYYLGVSFKVIGGLRGCLKVGFDSLSYSKDDGPMEEIGYPTTLFKMSPIGLAHGYPKAIPLVFKAGRYVLPFQCRWVTFRWTFRGSDTSFNVLNFYKYQPTTQPHPRLPTMYAATKNRPPHPSIDTVLISKEGISEYAHYSVLSRVCKPVNRRLDVTGRANVLDLQNVSIKVLRWRSVLYMMTIGESANFGDIVIETVVSADACRMRGLILKCEEFMIKQLHSSPENLTKMKDNCVQLYVFARTHNLQVLGHTLSSILLDQWYELDVLRSVGLQPYMTDLTELMVEQSRVHIQFEKPMQ